MGVAQPRIWDSYGNGFTTADLALISDRSTAGVSDIIRGDKVTKLKDYIIASDLRRDNGRPPIMIKDKAGNKFGVVEVGCMIERSRSWVIKARADFGCVSLEDYFNFRDRPTTKGARGDGCFIRLPFFDRKMCSRNNFETQCDHYTSCCDARLMGEHHPRCKRDGSCFTSKDIILRDSVERPTGSWESMNVRCPEASTKNPQEYWRNIRQEVDGEYDRGPDQLDDRYMVRESINIMKRAAGSHG